MSPAHHDAVSPAGDGLPPCASALSVTADHVNLSVHGKLGFDSWRAICAAREMAMARQVPLRVEIGACDAADLAGIGSLLIAIDKLGSIEMAGCNERSRNWFSHLGICRGCAAATAACRPRVQ